MLKYIMENFEKINVLSFYENTLIAKFDNEKLKIYFNLEELEKRENFISHFKNLILISHKNYMSRTKEIIFFPNHTKILKTENKITFVYGFVKLIVMNVFDSVYLSGCLSMAYLFE